MREYHLIKVHKSNYYCVVCIYLCLACAHLCNDVIARRSIVLFFLLLSLHRWDFSGETKPFRWQITLISNGLVPSINIIIIISIIKMYCVFNIRTCCDMLLGDLFLRDSVEFHLLILQREQRKSEIEKHTANVFRCHSNLHTNQFHLIYKIFPCRGVAAHRTFCMFAMAEVHHFTCE